AEKIIPAADVSQQISTAGMEASGTGNMKFALNGAVTVGTLDGANVEIAERVGDDNIYIFGLTADEAAAIRDGYDPARHIAETPALAEVIEQIDSGVYSPGEPGRYRPLIEMLRTSDYFLVAADFAAYSRAQRRIDHDFRDAEAWTRRAVLNTAHSGWFSSDRTIRGYAREIWEVESLL
ncbi:MAG TPA: glycogen/starch/alpha-glucan phosphorylase, partial [Thermohalobaculum sp.]|nr:glycogen/starch/alpha-glucan phosphorylase [Thermohalobaculum sp.]